MRQNLPLLSRSFLVLFLLALTLTVDLKAQESKRNHFAENTKVLKKNAPPLDIEYYVFTLINRKRAEFGLHSLQWNEQTARVARLHSQNMAKFKFFGHRGLDGKTVDKRADSLGLSKWRMIGENIASLRGYSEPLKRVIECWMQSPGHRENLLKENWKESGVGIAISSEGTYYLTQVFLKK